jgi:hypothetical protein
VHVPVLYYPAIYIIIFVPIVRLLQSRVEPRVYFIFLEEFRESHLSTLLYIFPSSPPLLRTTFPPFPRPLWGAPDHPERIVAALGSPKVNAVLAWSTPPSTRPERGNHGPPWFIARIADQNQYNKLLGNVRITFREFGSDRIQYSNLLEL